MSSNLFDDIVADIDIIDIGIDIDDKIGLYSSVFL